jgi:integrase
MALTDVEIRTAKPLTDADGNPKANRLYDTGGLYLLVSESGGKLWRWNYRYHRKPKTMALGKYPGVSLADARNARQRVRNELANGNDPAAQRNEEKAAVNAQAEKQKAADSNSFKAVALKWHKWWARGVDSDTAAYILRRLEADVFPAFGRRPIVEIKPADIRNLLISIEQGTGNGRRFKGKGARDVAQRHHGTISQIFRYAVVHELAEINPAAAFRPSDVLRPRKTVHRAHIVPSQLPALLVAMDNYGGHSVWRYALKLMAMLFVRTAELLQAPWSEFDLDNARWVISPERMKMDRPHIVPLPRQAVEYLRELKHLAGDKRFVFPGLNSQTANATINCNTLLNVLEEIGYKGVMTGHGFRGLARTILAEHGFEKAHVELQLAHANDDKTDAAYNHALYLPQRTELMQWWADYLDTELNKGMTKVVAIRKTA